MEDPLETAKLWNMGCIILLIRVECPHNIVVLPQEVGEGMPNRKDRMVDSLHGMEGMDRIIRAR